MNEAKLGWIAPAERTRETHEAHERMVAAMPKYANASGTKKTLAVGEKIILTDYWKSPIVVAALGYAFPRIHQLTGSCVGAGGGNCQFTLAAIEIIKNGDLGEVKIPFWLYTYGKSRQRAGMRGQGEGSIGSAYAEAARLDGYVPADIQGLPSFRNSDGLVWTEHDEMVWSDGAAIDDSWSQKAKNNLVKQTAQITSVEDALDNICNGRPLTIATDYYINNATVKGSGDNAVTFGRFDSNGGHQTSTQGAFNHPDLGLLFLNQNNWPAQCYPPDPAGGAPCSVWMSEKDMEMAVTKGEVYAFSQFEDFPSVTLPDRMFKITGV